MPGGGFKKSKSCKIVRILPPEIVVSVYKKDTTKEIAPFT